MKKISTKLLILVLAFTCVLSLFVSCDGQAPETPSTETTPPPPSTPAPPEEPTPVVLTDFERYQSNTHAPSGNNSALKSATAVTETYRGVYPIQEYGALDYKFFFSNNVNSTYEHGSNSYREMPTSTYVIESAIVGTSRTPASARSLLDNPKQLLFNGQVSRSVSPKETFWSDAITVDVPENHFLVFEWTVSYTIIPSTKVSTTMTAMKKNESSDTFKISSEAPLPDLIGCDRGAKLRVGFIGDSITMGEFAGTEYWVAQVAKGLGNDVSVWNLGLGYSRADDAANSPSWLYKAKQCDVVGICFGVNDINSGPYQVSRPATKNEIIADISKIAEELTAAGVEVIIFSTPPYTFSTTEKVNIWRETVAAEKALAEQKGYQFFDFAACLAAPSAPETPLYGGHPNAEGCTIVANKFLEQQIIKIPE